MRRIALSARAGRLCEVAFWLLMAASFFVAPGKLSLLSQVMIAGLFAVSLDMALGYAGILTVGHAAFFGVGAYTAGLLAKHGWGEPLSGLVAAMAVAGMLGWLLSFLVVRGADLTRLMITIGVGVLLAEVANRLSGITGGSDGLQGVEMWPVLGLFRFDMFGKTAFVYSFVVVALAFLVVRMILNSPFGLVLRGVHDNARRMRAIGSPVEARLRMAYCFAASIAGLAGALLAQTTQFVGIETLSFDRSAEILIILVVGGSGRLYGGLIGAIVYMLVHDLFADFDPRYWQFWLGIFLIVVVLVGRGGIMGVLSRRFKLERSR